MTGDLGWIDERGYLFLTGRRNSLIPAAGGTVDPAAVEAVIATLPGVREVAVVGVPISSGRARVKAVVAAEGLTAASVIQHCRRFLEAGQIPEIVEFREALPRTAAGKILRRALRTAGGSSA
jgi:long-chain acyl-CoA synthetase